MLDSGPIRGPEIGTVCDLGLASWLKQPPQLAALSCVDLHEASRAEPASPTELTRVIADIVVALALETGHADLRVTSEHLKRDAYLYIRQSTLRQVAEHGESTQRQYALRDRAVAVGWPVERVHVIDCDLGKSGANAAARDGFQQLVSEVALGKAGIVMGLEVSRLARNSADWHRLIELCALTSTLILDEDATYDPTCFNDRLLLGLKRTVT